MTDQETRAHYYPRPLRILSVLRAKTFARAASVLGRLLEEFAADQPAADLRGAGADLVELGVAQQPAGGVVVDGAVAAQALDRLERHPCRLLGRVENAAGGVLALGLAPAPPPGDRVNGGPVGAAGPLP